MTGKIFINYRRGDDAGHTGRLFDRLQDVFPPEQLFLDVDNIAPGLDFVRVLNERVADCDIVLAVIGKGWLDSRDAAGNRRLEDPDDFVRIEITSALNQEKRVIPVLVGEAQMPRPEDLPAALQPLTRRNAVRLTHERFRADTQGLIKAIQQGLAEIDARHKAEAEAGRRGQEEEQRQRQQAEAARRAEACRLGSSVRFANSRRESVRLNAPSRRSSPMAGASLRPVRMGKSSIATAIAIPSNSARHRGPPHQKPHLKQSPQPQRGRLPLVRLGSAAVGSGAKSIQWSMHQQVYLANTPGKAGEADGIVVIRMRQGRIRQLTRFIKIKRIRDGAELSMVDFAD